MRALAAASDTGPRGAAGAALTRKGKSEHAIMDMLVRLRLIGDTLDSARNVTSSLETSSMAG